MKSLFYISNERYESVKKMIRNLPSLRFIQNPYQLSVSGNWCIYLSGEVEDFTKLQVFMNELDELNSKKYKKPSTKSFWTKIKDFFN